MDSPLQLDRYQIDVLEVTANESCAGPGVPVVADIGILPKMFSHKDDPSRHQVILELTFRSAPGQEVLPYEVHVKGRAFFHVEGDVDADEASNLVRFNGSAILLGLYRGLVAQVTAQGPNGTFLIPPLNLVAAFEEIAKQKAEATAKKAPRKKKAAGKATPAAVKKPVDKKPVAAKKKIVAEKKTAADGAAASDE